MGVSRSRTDHAESSLPHFAVADLSTVDGCRAAVGECAKTFGPVDILVCNHGVGSAAEVPLQEHGRDEGGSDGDGGEGNDENDAAVRTWRTAMDTNLEGPYHLTRLVLPSMVERGYGRCVYVSSTAAIEAEPAAVGYNTSKAALLGLMKSVCQDGGPHGVTANAVLPGWVRTEMAERSAIAEAEERGVSKEKIWEERAALYPAKRVVEPEEVANAILFLSSQESSGVSGEALRVSLGCPW